MNFLVLLSRDRIKLFDIDNNYEAQFIDGVSELEYDLNRAKDSIERIIKELAVEYNLEAIEKKDEKAGKASEFYKEIKLYVLDSSDSAVNKIVRGILDEYIQKEYSVNNVLLDIIHTLEKNPANMIADYGLNYDGKNYRIINGQIEKSEFNLLGYTVKSEIIIESIRDLIIV